MQTTTGCTMLRNLYRTGSSMKMQIVAKMACWLLEGPCLNTEKVPSDSPSNATKNREPQINRSREQTPSVWGVFILLGKFREGVAFVVGLVSSPHHPPTFSPQELQWSKDHGASRNRLSSPPVPGEILLKELTCFLRCLEDIP